MRSILQLFDIKVNEHPEKQLFVFLDIKGNVKESYTYQEFYDRVNNIASLIYKQKFKRGDRILLAYPAGLEVVCAFFACVRLGLIPVPVYPPRSSGFRFSVEKMNFIAKDCEASAILTNRTYYWSVKIKLELPVGSASVNKKNYSASLKWIISDDSPASGEADFKQAHSDLLFLQYTSGSTNNPKGVMVSHQNMIDNLHNAVDHLPIGVSWLPQYHDMGLIGYYIFFALKGGTTYGFSPTDFIFKPSLWLETITKFQGTATSAPSFAYEYCLLPGKISEECLDSLDLSSLRYVMNAAEPVKTKIYAEFIDKFKAYGLNPESSFAAYGLAENTLAVSNYGRKYFSFSTEGLKNHKVQIVDPSEPDIKATSLMSCGKPLGDTKIKIVSQITLAESEANEVGEVWISGSSKCLGYWNRPKLTKETFFAQISNDESESKWLRSGDLGFIQDGELYISGRLKDMIIIRGLNYYPQDIELLVEQDDRVRKGCVAAFSSMEDGIEKLIVIVGLKNKKKVPVAAELNSQISNYLGISVDFFVFVSAKSVSKTSSGKIMRHENKHRYLNDDFKIIAKVNSVEKDTSSGQDSDNQLDLLFRNYKLSVNEIESVGDAGLDSLRMAEFLYDLKAYVKSKGFNGLAQEIDIRIVQKIAVSELYEVLNGLQPSSQLSTFRFKKAIQKIYQEYAKIEQEIMKNDSICSVNIEDLKNSAEAGSKSNIIFLTGGTGFFGPFLIKSILEQCKGEIYILVRALDKEAAVNRLKEAFIAIDEEELFDENLHSRIKPIVGDLSKVRLGMTIEGWDYLTKHVDLVYHNGALVNYLLDYESMRNTNVGGTNEVIRFSLLAKEKVLNYISTTFIFGWSTKDVLYETDSNEIMDRLDFGYSQSKWVSEKVVQNAMKRGLNARIFRPALISPSLAGDGYNFDISMRLMAFMVKHKIGTSANNQVSYTPADLGANNIVAISNIQESIGKTFHVTRDEFASMLDITAILSQFIGRPFTNFSLLNFVPEVVGRCKKDDLLFPLLNFLVRSVDNISAMEFKRYDNRNYMKYRDMSAFGLQDKPLEEVVRGIFRFMVKHKLIESSGSVD